jgi:hypothetical protein
VGELSNEHLPSVERVDVKMSEPSQIKRDAIELCERMRSGNNPGLITVGVGLSDDKPCIYVYWKSKAAMRQCGHATRYGAWPMIHKVMGQPVAQPATPNKKGGPRAH